MPHVNIIAFIPMIIVFYIALTITTKKHGPTFGATIGLFLHILIHELAHGFMSFYTTGQRALVTAGFTASGAPAGLTNAGIQGFSDPIVYQAGIVAGIVFSIIFWLFTMSIKNPNHRIPYWMAVACCFGLDFYGWLMPTQTNDWVLAGWVQY